MAVSDDPAACGGGGSPVGFVATYGESELGEPMEAFCESHAYADRNGNCVLCGEGVCCR